ncbi:MAG TPA: pyridoxal-phosphate dependent enzyme [Methanomassiliicoccales archaeon]
MWRVLNMWSNSILETIGRTPLVKLNRLARGLDATVLVKLEFMNPGGSSKDRIALSMVTKAESSGELKEGSSLVESTSGNTGFGLAMVAKRRIIMAGGGMRAVLERSSQEEQACHRLTEMDEHILGLREIIRNGGVVNSS